MNAYTTLPIESTFAILYPGNLSLQAWNYPVNPHSPAECPCRQRETLRTALMRRSTCVKHIRVVAVYVTWHVLWCKQWTLTTGIVVVVIIGVKPAHLEFGDSTMGPCAAGVSFFTDHFLSGRGQRISTCVATTETTNRTSHYFCFQNHFNIGMSMSGNQIQICPNILQHIMQWAVLNIQSIFSWRFINA